MAKVNNNQSSIDIRIDERVVYALTERLDYIWSDVAQGTWARVDGRLALRLRWRVRERVVCGQGEQ